MDELLLMASQRYEEQEKTQNGNVDEHKVHCVLKETEIEMDELLLMASQRYEEQEKTQNGSVDKRNAHCVPKETETNVVKTSIVECEQDREEVATTGIDEMPLMASQQYKEQKGVLQVLNDLFPALFEVS